MPGGYSRQGRCRGPVRNRRGVTMSSESPATGSPEAGAGPHRVRASDAERERIAQILSTATADGLLTLEEADERLAAAYDARYRDELGPLTADLPVDTGLPQSAA